MANKYNAQKITFKGMIFDSKKEFHRYLVLEDMLRHGEIEKLMRQVVFTLIERQKHGRKTVREVKYVADFAYYKDGKQVVEDVKGYRGGEAYKIFKIKQKLMLERYGLWVEEI